MCFIRKYGEAPATFTERGHLTDSLTCDVHVYSELTGSKWFEVCNSMKDWSPVIVFHSKKLKSVQMLNPSLEASA